MTYEAIAVQDLFKRIKLNMMREWCVRGLCLPPDLTSLSSAFLWFSWVAQMPLDSLQADNCPLENKHQN